MHGLRWEAFERGTSPSVYPFPRFPAWSPLLPLGIALDHSLYKLPELELAHDFFRRVFCFRREGNRGTAPSPLRRRCGPVPVSRPRLPICPANDKMIRYPAA